MSCQTRKNLSSAAAAALHAGHDHHKLHAASLWWCMLLLCYGHPKTCSQSRCQKSRHPPAAAGGSAEPRSSLPRHAADEGPPHVVQQGVRPQRGEVAGPVQHGGDAHVAEDGRHKQRVRDTIWPSSVSPSGPNCTTSCARMHMPCWTLHHCATYAGRCCPVHTALHLHTQKLLACPASTA